MFKEKIAVITGGAHGIGKCIAEEFRKQGVCIEVIDKKIFWKQEKTLTSKNHKIKYLRRNTGLIGSYRKMIKVLFICRGKTIGKNA